MTREEKALKIAELEGYFRLKNKPKYKVPIVTKKVVANYSSFNGLMPIVVKINSNPNIPYIIEIKFDCIDYDIGYSIEYNNPEQLIDALQDAIIFYHENKKEWV